MRFLVDAQLPPALARWLEANGHDAEHVAEIGLATASDAVIWQKALDIAAVLVTKDEDFAIRAAVSPNSPAILWIRFGNTTRQALIARLADVFAPAIGLLELGERLVELR